MMYYGVVTNFIVDSFNNPDENISDNQILLSVRLEKL